MTRKSVFVTGGARRIGATIARTFGDAGWHVVIHYSTSREEAQALCDSLSSAEIVRCDLLNTAAARGVVADLLERIDDWQVLVNCASVFQPDEADAPDEEVFNRAMAVNARSPAAMAQAFLSDRENRSGRVVINITDQKLENTNPDFFSYTASKHALAAATGMQALDRSLHADDRIYDLAPGAILPSYDQDPKETDVSHRLNLLQRKTKAAEVAQAALWLAEGNLQSGESLFIDSGQHLLSQPRDVIYLAREKARP
ncbi:SDR family oxidoreductase [Pseudopontixanthobacter vadosimaris]|uniref:SDR family oxidoreductase n=1 Tax=Pseudopontixanthobacter vadosimaris TaxID=2726450 RepID=UPI001475BE04|nr:SDR family oxidoreductase [Pseudopontixanthobacter vadosimaris]